MSSAESVELCWRAASRVLAVNNDNTQANMSRGIVATVGSRPSRARPPMTPTTMPAMAPPEMPPPPPLEACVSTVATGMTMPPLLTLIRSTDVT